MVTDKSKEAMKLALEALKQIDNAMPFPVAKLAQAALREALAEQPAQQEPVAKDNSNYRLDPPWRLDPRYTTPQQAQRTWVGLTDEEKHEAVSDEIGRIRDYEDYADAIEAQLRERNT